MASHLYHKQFVIWGTPTLRQSRSLPRQKEYLLEPSVGWDQNFTRARKGRPKPKPNKTKIWCHAQVSSCYKRKSKDAGFNGGELMKMFSNKMHPGCTRDKW